MSSGDRDLLTVETTRGSEQTISTTKYEVTGRGGKGKELMQRGGFTRVVPNEVAAPVIEGAVGNATKRERILLWLASVTELMRICCRPHPAPARQSATFERSFAQSMRTSMANRHAGDVALGGRTLS